MSDGLSTTSAAYADMDREQMLASTDVPALSFPIPAPRLAKRESTAVDATPDEPSIIVQRLATFVGPNFEAYLDYYENVFDSKDKGLFRHWHWVPFAFSVPWLFLRRRYGMALGSAALPFGLGLLLPLSQGLAIALVIIALLCGVAGRFWYVRMALKKVTEIEAQRLWPVQRDDKLQDSGGVSLIGAVCGTIVWLAIVIGPYLAGWMS